MKGFSSRIDTPKPRKKLLKRWFSDRHEKLYGWPRLYASAKGRHETCGFLSLFSSVSFDISMKNSSQRWSSRPVSSRIRKMAQVSNVLSTLPLSSSSNKSMGENLAENFSCEINVGKKWPLKLLSCFGIFNLTTAAASILKFSTLPHIWLRARSPGQQSNSNP